MTSKASDSQSRYDEVWRAKRPLLAKMFRDVTPALRHMRKRPATGRRMSLPVSARRFCVRINRGEADYIEPGRLLRDFLAKKLSEEEVATRINSELKARPLYWRLWTHYATSKRRVSKFGSRFVLDRGEIPEDPWRSLARLLGDGATLGRVRVCALETCPNLFWDMSAPGRRAYCSQKHKNLVNQRRSRQRRRR
jgi:hypothetical protein